MLLSSEASSAGWYQQIIKLRILTGRRLALPTPCTESRLLWGPLPRYLLFENRKHAGLRDTSQDHPFMFLGVFYF
jgi:hypothetical protein